ncbi:MAG TPA: hypothetical protein VHT96_01265 [Clostridia bacterium]|nr:hypothetical protein [Clostridia bacterium]
MNGDGCTHIGQPVCHTFIIKLLREGDGTTNIIVYYPKSESGKQELAKRVATVHAQSVVEYIKKLSCPLEQKVKLIEAIKQIHKNSAGE